MNIGVSPTVYAISLSMRSRICFAARVRNGEMVSDKLKDNNELTQGTRRSEFVK